MQAYVDMHDTDSTLLPHITLSIAGHLPLSADSGSTMSPMYDPTETLLNATLNATHVSHGPSNWTRFIVETMISLPIAVLGIIGNILAFIVLVQMLPKLTTNVWLMSIVAADSLVLVFTILLRSFRYLPYFTDLLTNYGDIYPVLYVYAYPWVYFVRLLTTWLCVMLTFDRFVVVCRPLHVSSVCTFARTYKHLAFVIFAALVFTIPRFFEMELTSENDFGFQYSDLMHHSVYTVMYRIFLFFFVMYLLPVVLLAMMNRKLVVALRRADTFRGSVRSSLGSDRPPISNSSRSVTTLVIAVVILAIISSSIAMTSQLLLSLNVCFPELTFIVTPRRYVSLISNIFVTLNSAINIVIYCFSSRKFRNHFRYTFLHCCQPKRSIIRYNSRHSSSFQTTSFSLHNGRLSSSSINYNNISKTSPTCKSKHRVSDTSLKRYSSGASSCILQPQPLLSG